MNEIEMYIIPQTVKVRRYDVDIDKLKSVLRMSKQNSNLTNKDISEILNVPKTKVEHWFRCDSSFAIPDENIWFDLKQLLDIQTNEFDLSITEFDYKLGNYDKGNRFYGVNGIAPTLTTSDNIFILQEET